MCAMFEDTANLEDSYCMLPSQLPILCNSQGFYFQRNGRSVDFDSIKERLDVILLGSGKMPEADRTVTGRAMSRFLFNADQDDAYMAQV